MWNELKSLMPEYSVRWHITWFVALWLSVVVWVPVKPYERGVNSHFHHVHGKGNVSGVNHLVE